MKSGMKCLFVVSLSICMALTLLAPGCGQQEPLQLCFVSSKADVADYTEIYVMNADGSNRINLTDNPALDADPSWSPDGEKIAFASRGEIYVMDADGNNLTRLTHSEGSEFMPRWSPDGKRIAFLHEGALSVMGADGTHQTSLVHQIEADGYFVWSPDGTRIAFNSQQLGIVVLTVDTGSLFSTGNKADWGPSWSPDGKRIAFISDRDGACEIYVMGDDGGNLNKLTSSQEQFVESMYAGIVKYGGIVGCGQQRGPLPQWSPDGNKIAVPAISAGSADIWVIDADGSNLTNLTNNLPGTGVVGSISLWSPDGKKIAFVGTDMVCLFTGIFVMDADGSNLTQLSPSGSVDRHPSWRPR